MGHKPDKDKKKSESPSPAEQWAPLEEAPPLAQKVRRFLVGKPRDLSDTSIFHQLSLIAFLAWVGLGADGLSSSSYGPEEAFRAIEGHNYLAVALALSVIVTIFIISAAYSHLIEHFPMGGGYLVASKLLGARVGVISGCALIVDYVLTITVSIAAAGDALFSFLPPAWMPAKLTVEVFLIIALTVLNIRGVRESIMVLLPIFILFLITHILLIGGSLGKYVGNLPQVSSEIGQEFGRGWQGLGLGGMMLLFVHAYSMGGGTYTGLEAVSNSVPIMREPKVPTAKRTMVYMAISLSFMAAGLLVCYLLIGVHHVPGKTFNAVLVERFAGNSMWGRIFQILTLVSEGGLLVVAAQAGFIGGPRVLANMANDSWVPRRFSALSDRLTTQNGIMLMGVCSLATLLYRRGDVHLLVIMYSINVFLTFSLSMLGMLLFWWGLRTENPLWRRRVALFTVGLALCATVLVITTMTKFVQGGWVTLAVTGACIILCFMIRRHYRAVGAYLMEFDKSLLDLPFPEGGTPPPLDPMKRTAGVLVGGYGGTGIHMLLNTLKAFPNYFHNLVFLSVGIIDSGQFKGTDEIEALKETTEQSLKKYVELANKMGFPADYRFSIGTDVVDESEELCKQVAHEFPRTTFFAGQVVFQREKWFHRYLHNQTSFNIQKRLHWSGLTMVILPMRVRANGKHGKAKNQKAVASSQ